MSRAHAGRAGRRRRRVQVLVTRSRTKVAHPRPTSATRRGPGAAHDAVLERLSAAMPHPPPRGRRRYEIYHDVLADAVLTWRAAHEAERRVADERPPRRRPTGGACCA